MQITGATGDQLIEALTVADDRLDIPGFPNLIFNRFDRLPLKRAPRFAVTLRVRDSKGPMARRSHTGRRMVSACWHAHRDFLVALFDIVPDAHVVSVMATYEDRDDFERSFYHTGGRNLGSIADPMRARYACECEEGW